MKDTIYRQAVIDAISEEDANGMHSCFASFQDSQKFKQIIVQMPSAEPEIIRCKDCKHMIINEKHEAKPMICCFTKMCGTTEPDWFCADGERRDDE